MIMSEWHSMAPRRLRIKGGTLVTTYGENPLDSKTEIKLKVSKKDKENRPWSSASSGKIKVDID